jgi:hypothetical protein
MPATVGIEQLLAVVPHVAKRRARARLCSCGLVVLGENSPTWFIIVLFLVVRLFCTAEGLIQSCNLGGSGQRRFTVNGKGSRTDLASLSVIVFKSS